MSLLSRTESAASNAVERDLKEETTGLTFDAALERFMTGAQAIVDAHYAKHFPPYGPNRRTMGAKLTTMRGIRYIRVVTSSTWDGEVDGSSRSVYCFIDTQTGDVLKAEGWKKPAKHPRGNIYSADPVSGVTQHGAKYL
jgi:hypothetical protein